MDPYEALLASLGNPVAPSSCPTNKAEGKTASATSATSNDLGKNYFEEVTPKSWIARDSFVHTSSLKSPSRKTANV